jgi:hypothetical protein
MVKEKDILGLQIGMDEVQVVQEGDRSQQLASEGLDVGAREWYKAAVLEEVEDAQAQQGCDYTYVSPPIEAVLELYTAVAVLFISSAQSLEDAELDPAGISVLRRC